MPKGMRKKNNSKGKILKGKPPKPKPTRLAHSPMSCLK